MLVPQAIQDGFVAATNAVRGATMTLGDQAPPIGSFTDPEYAQVGLTEAKARETHDAAIAIAAGMRVDDLAQIPLSFLTYAGILGRVAASAARQFNLKVIWQAHQVEMGSKGISW
jgi:dihydrolipoamide dehydrogenase